VLEKKIVKSLELDAKTQNNMKEQIIKFSESKIKRNEDFMRNLQ
jgi:hypothetical protein